MDCTILKGEDDINLASLKVSLSRLDKKWAELKKNKEHSKLEELTFSSSEHIELSLNCSLNEVQVVPMALEIDMIFQLEDKLRDSSVSHRSLALMWDLNSIKGKTSTWQCINFGLQN